jgi:hypothetical protein
MSFWSRIGRKALTVIPESAIVIAILICGNYAKSVDSRITADGEGYYDYLPSIFIRGDFVRKDVPAGESMAKYPEVWSKGTYVTVDGYRADKYFCGVAVLISPFFIAAKLLSEPGDNGYSALFETTVLVAALFYVFLGLVFLRLLLRQYAVKTWAIIATQCFIGLGTSVLFYSTLNSTYSHVYSFAAVTAFLFFAKQYFSTHSKRNFWWMAFVFGIVLLIRPVNILVVLTLPFIAGSWEGFIAGIKSAFTRPKMLVIGLLITGTIYFLQPLAWYLQSGKFWVDTYANEHFDFTQPHVGEFLFGFRRGVFVYAPVLLLGLLGIFSLMKKFSKWTAVTLLCSLLAVAYILSCWHDYAYGASFGSRVFIEYYALLAIPMAVLLSGARWFNVLLLPFGAFCMYVAVIQSWQYTHFVLHWGQMDYNKYRLVFLETNQRYQGVLWKPMVYREWDSGESVRRDSAVLKPFNCDTMYFNTLHGTRFLDPGLLLIDFDNTTDFDADELGLVDVTVTDSVTGKIVFYSSPPLFWFQESDTTRHGSYFFDLPEFDDTTSKQILVRVFSNENKLVLRNFGVTIYRWKE